MKGLLLVAIGVGVLFAFGKKKTTVPGTTAPEGESYVPTGPDYATAAAMLGLTVDQYKDFLNMAASGQLNATTAAMMGLTPEMFDIILANSYGPWQ